MHRNVRATGWVSLLTDLSSEMIYPLLPLFLKSVLQSGMAFIGLIEGAAETTASLLKLWSGRRADRVADRKGMVLWGYGLSTVARPLVAVAGAAWHVLAIRVADRVGKGIRTSPRDALIADSTPPEERGRAFGFQRAMDHAGALLGPLAAAALLWAMQDVWHMPHELSLRSTFALAALPGILSLWVIARFLHEVPRTQPPAGSLSFRGLGSTYYRYLGAVVLFTLGNSSDAFLLLRAHEAGLPEWQIPLLWAAFHAVKSATSFLGGVLSDRVGRRPLILGGWLVYALCYAAFGLAEGAWQVVGIFLFYGLYHGCTEGTERAFVADLAPTQLRGSAYGCFHAVVGLAALPASVLFGALWQLSGSATLPFLTGATMALAAAVWLSLIRIRSPA